MNETDRRSLLKSAAAAAALGLVETQASEAQGKGLQFGPVEHLLLRSLEATCRAKGERALCWAAASGAVDCGKDRLRSLGQDQFRHRPRALCRRPGRFPVSFFHLGMFFPEIGRDACRRGRRRRARSSTIRAISTCRRIHRAQAAAGRGFCRVAHSGAEGQHPRLAQERLGRLSRRGLFSRHRRIAPIWPFGAAASRSTSRSPDEPEEFPDFTQYLYRRPRTRTIG